MAEKGGAKRKKGRREEEAAAELGFGGLFKGLGAFIDLLGEMVEKGEQTATRTGEFRVKGLGEKARGVYGVNVRFGLGGEPHVEPFGNIRPTEEGPEVAEVREPLVDVFDEGGEVVVAAELPGTAEDEVRLRVKGNVLALKTTGERKYAKEIHLPHRVDAKSLRQSYKNGILEARLKKA